MLSIRYQSQDFPAGLAFTNGWGQLDTSWSELLWSALTVGRPNVHHVFRHGRSSYHEAMFRLSLVRMALEEAGTLGGALLRTPAYDALDPSEKGAVSYLLGLDMAALFAFKRLDCPWVLHLDVFGAPLNPVFKGRSRPDLVGLTRTGEWLVLECKGRVGGVDGPTRDQVKTQAAQIESIDGVVPTYAIGAVTHFSGNELRFFWVDPPPPDDDGLALSLPPGAWRQHYELVLALVQAADNGVERLLSGDVRVPIEQADIEVGIHPAVLKLLLAGEWDEARRVAVKLELNPRGDYFTDGIAVVAGASWSEPFPDHEGGE